MDKVQSPELEIAKLWFQVVNDGLGHLYDDDFEKFKVHCLKEVHPFKGTNL